MTYARARRRAMRDPWYTNRCYGCYHLNTPEWAPFCSAFCHDAWSARVLAEETPGD